jgi:transcription elongation GreA/GreB family factor
VTGETFTLSTLEPEEEPTAARPVTVRPGSCVEYETTDPVTGGVKRVSVFIMRTLDDQISEEGVQPIKNATPVARALLEAEAGDEVFLDEDGPNARPLRVIRVW